MEKLFVCERKDIVEEERKARMGLGFSQHRKPNEGTKTCVKWFNHHSIREVS
jgi:hypothetical protein